MDRPSLLITGLTLLGLFLAVPIGLSQLIHKTKNPGGLRALGRYHALDEGPRDHQLQSWGIDGRNPDARAVTRLGQSTGHCKAAGSVRSADVFLQFIVRRQEDPGLSEELNHPGLF